MGRFKPFRLGLTHFIKSVWVANFALPPVLDSYQEQHWPDEPILGQPPNLGHDADTYSADWAESADRNTRGLVTSLSGKLQRGDITVTAGHAHEDYLTELEYQNFGRWRPLGDNQGTGGPDASKGLLYVTNTAVGGELLLMAHIPEHIRDVELWVRVSQPAPGAGGTPDGWLWINALGYDLNGDQFATLEVTRTFAAQSVAGGVQVVNQWIGPLVLDLEMLNFTTSRGQWWVAFLLQPVVSAGGTIGGLWEAAIRRRVNSL